MAGYNNYNYDDKNNRNNEELTEKIYSNIVRDDLRAVYRLYIEKLYMISDYIYQSIIARSDEAGGFPAGTEISPIETISSPSLSDTFDDMAQTEARHFEELGRLVRELGGNSALHFDRAGNTACGTSDDGYEEGLIDGIIDRERAMADELHRLSGRIYERRHAALLESMARESEANTICLEHSFGCR